MCVFVCVCVRARVRACVFVRVRMLQLALACLRVRAVRNARQHTCHVTCQTDTMKYRSRDSHDEVQVADSHHGARSGTLATATVGTAPRAITYVGL